MDISINSGYFRRRREGGAPRGEEECALLCKAGGISILDATPNYFLEEDWEGKTQRFAEFLAKNGMAVGQSHAPFNRYRKEATEVFRKKLERCLSMAAMLGAKQIVIHADDYVAPQGKAYDSEAACRFAYEFYAPFVEKAAKLGIGVAVENLFEDGLCGAERSRCTSTVEEVLRIVELFGEKAVSVCWDFGHAAAAYGEQMLTALQKVAPLVTCTHVHDNYFWQDLHLPVFHGKVDWEEEVRCLCQAGYKGNFTFEYVYGTLADEAAVDFLRYQKKAVTVLLQNAGFSVNG